jgi:ectoine hydroxylase-related dioxygenase (phytanoyl-CoA dioxygenase family)
MSIQLHSRNTSFTWEQPSPPFSFINQKDARSYGERGFFVCEDAFGADEIAAVVAAIDPLEAQTEAFLRSRKDGTYGIARAGEITFRPHLVTRSPVLRDFSKHRVFLGLVRDLIGPNVRLYWDQSVYKKPETRKEFPWHQDNGYTYVEPQQYLTCWVALTHATVDNGCPWLVPGLHRHGTLAHWSTPVGYRCLEKVEGAVPVELTAGSIAVFSSLTPHRTGSNLTNGVRKAYILQYAPDGARIFRDEQDGELANAADRQYFVLKNGHPA